MRRGVLHGSLIKGAEPVHWVPMPKKWQKLADSVRPENNWQSKKIREGKNLQVE
jgi:hypothetical protein